MAAAVLAIPSAAHAEISVDVGCAPFNGKQNCSNKLEHFLTTDPALNSVVALCDKHHHHYVYGTRIIKPSDYYYDDGWNDAPLHTCDAIIEKWKKATFIRTSTEAWEVRNLTHFNPQDEQEKRDLEFVQDYAAQIARRH
jgi:hypothetical protein